MDIVEGREFSPIAVTESIGVRVAEKKAGVVGVRADWRTTLGCNPRDHLVVVGERRAAEERERGDADAAKLDGVVLRVERADLREWARGQGWW